MVHAAKYPNAPLFKLLGGLAGVEADNIPLCSRTSLKTLKYR
jgi:hypothetical protein